MCALLHACIIKVPLSRVCSRYVLISKCCLHSFRCVSAIHKGSTCHISNGPRCNSNLTYELFMKRILLHLPVKSGLLQVAFSQLLSFDSSVSRSSMVLMSVDSSAVWTCCKQLWTSDGLEWTKGTSSVQTNWDWMSF